MTKISSPVLAPANDQAVYVDKGKLMLLDDTFEQGQLLISNIDGARCIKWSPDGIYIAFILKEKLEVVTVSTAQVVEVPLGNVSQFEWGVGATIYATANEGALYEWSLQGEVRRLLGEAFIEAYSAAKQMAIIKRTNQLYALELNENNVGDLQEVTPQTGQYGQVAFSFTGQYVAYIGESDVGAERHLFVYDFDLGITQNLTEMLNVYAGDAMVPHMSTEQGVKEIQWIETDALYFLLSSDGDVRLYYADLYGSLFPASPESEHIVSYSVARSGNWALYVANQPFVEARLDWFDITMGEGRTIVAQPISKFDDVKTYYEIVDTEDGTYYIWGYVPSQCKKAVVILSGQRRMLGNGYEVRLADELNAKKAVIYVNHAGALGYGAAYAKTVFNEMSLQNIVEDWLLQKAGRRIVIERMVN